MNLTKCLWIAPFAGMLLANSAAQAGPTKDQVTALAAKTAPDTFFAGTRSDNNPIGLLANRHGFSMDYGSRTSSQRARYSCGGADKVGLAGGKGNPTLNCTLNNAQNPNAPAWVPRHPTEVRLEWISDTEVKYEEWPSMKAKAGQTRNQPAHFTGTLRKQ